MNEGPHPEASPTRILLMSPSSPVTRAGHWASLGHRLQGARRENIVLTLRHLRAGRRIFSYPVAAGERDGGGEERNRRGCLGRVREGHRAGAERG